MRVIFTISELTVGNILFNKIVRELNAIGVKTGLQPNMTVAALKAAAEQTPKVFKFDEEQQLLIVSIPESTTTEVAKAVGEFYSDFIDLLPAIRSILNLFVKASNRYKTAIEKAEFNFKQFTKQMSD